MANKPDDRPTHPDFQKLVRAVNDNDNQADGSSGQDVLTSLGMSDPESLGYMAGQRVMRAVRHNFLSPETHALFSTLYMDAFALGARFALNDQREQSHAVAEALDGVLADLREGHGDPLAVLEDVAEKLR